ncbi:DMT family transporter [Hyphococcus luteus]|uniref:DMT family transporter n=1 Tax=Hyphococcus luteus TaxID=2058213 RepID=UPI0010574FFD|nr:DMT family transporter [Marinicaulis flavus]
MSLRELSVLFSVCFVWGVHFVVIKLAVGVLPPIFYAGIRMVLVALILSPFLTWRKGEMGLVLVGGLCLGAFNYGLMFSGMKFAPASAAAIAIELNVPFSTLLAVMFLGDRPGWRRLFGIALAFAGVAVIALGGSEDGAGGEEAARIGLGIGLVAAGALSEATGAVIVKRTTAFKPHELLAWFALVGAVALMTMSFFLEEGQGAAWASADRTLIVGAILYSALGASLFGHTAYYWLLQRLPISMVAPAVLFTTVIAVFSSVFLLGDPFGPRMAAGGLMTLAGVGVVLFRNVKKQAKNKALLEPQG